MLDNRLQGLEQLITTSWIFLCATYYLLLALLKRGEVSNHLPGSGSNMQAAWGLEQALIYVVLFVHCTLYLGHLYSISSNIFHRIGLSNIRSRLLPFLSLMSIVVSKAECNTTTKELGIRSQLRGPQTRNTSPILMPGETTWSAAASKHTIR